jgi:hypothetical protein
MTQVMAGWYPDPSGAVGERWWDGQVWSEHRRPYPAPPIAGPPATVQPRRNAAAFQGRTLGIVAVALAVSAVIFIVVGAKIFALSWMVATGLIFLALPATIVGIIAIVFSAIGLARAVQPRDRTPASVGLVLGIISTLTYVWAGFGTALILA